MSSRFCLLSVGDGDDHNVLTEFGNIQKITADNRLALYSSFVFVLVASTSIT
jgi:hypothetical protein